ncbi:preprotein translocase subunit SecG [Cytophagaceae bacterium ABcell3]|nr:preprotein translocase subunit SecG [Cytophagaceae bacterium ABcell3]
MITALIVLIIIVAVLLVLIVLAQNSKGGGLSSTFGGGANQLIGVKKTGDALEKITWGLAIGVLGLSFIFNVMADPGPTVDEAELTPAERRLQERRGLGEGQQREPADEDAAEFEDGIPLEEFEEEGAEQELPDLDQE